MPSVLSHIEMLLSAMVPSWYHGSRFASAATLPTYSYLCGHQPALPAAEAPAVHGVHQRRPHQLARERVEHRVEPGLVVVGDVPLREEEGHGLGQADGQALGAGGGGGPPAGCTGGAGGAGPACPPPGPSRILGDPSKTLLASPPFPAP